MRTLLLDPALQEKMLASPGRGSWALLESDVSRQGEKTAESSRKSAGYKLFCDMRRNINICILGLSPASLLGWTEARAMLPTGPSLSQHGHCTS